MKPVMFCKKRSGTPRWQHNYNLQTKVHLILEHTPRGHSPERYTSRDEEHAFGHRLASPESDWDARKSDAARIITSGGTGPYTWLHLGYT